LTVHAPGGTGALRVAADIIRRANPSARVWISQPTWPNHPGVIKAAGLEVENYPYFDAAHNTINFEVMTGVLRRASAGDVVILHGSCHNPTGCDPTPAQWRELAGLLAERGAVPLVDFAYQGFAEGLAADAAGILALAERVEELLIASSFSKNFGLYNERVGALTLVARSRAAAETALSQIKTQVRTNYSNPPAHGAAIVTGVLRSPGLRAEWEREVADMRGRIRGMRDAFVAGLAAAGAQRDFSFIERQHGMFSFTGLSKDQVVRLREEHAIYMVDSGRMNVAGLTRSNLPLVCKAMAQVLQG
jgi:aspartate/tyrosine/aromatic aminotransferase